MGTAGTTDHVFSLWLLRNLGVTTHGGSVEYSIQSVGVSSILCQLR